MTRAELAHRLVEHADAYGPVSRDGVTVQRTALGWTVSWPGGEVWCDTASEAVHRATQALSPTTYELVQADRRAPRGGGR
jgi:hypothetical protein